LSKRGGKKRRRSNQRFQSCSAEGRYSHVPEREVNKTTHGMQTEVTEGLTFIKWVCRHVGIRLTERDAVQRVGDVKSMRL
jgi:hypothetical protein